MNSRVKKENMEEVLRSYWHNEISPHVKKAIELLDGADNLDMKVVRMLHQHIELAEAGIKRYRHVLFEFYGGDEVLKEVKKHLLKGDFAEAKRILGL